MHLPEVDGVAAAGLLKLPRPIVGAFAIVGLAFVSFAATLEDTPPPISTGVKVYGFIGLVPLP